MMRKSIKVLFLILLAVVLVGGGIFAGMNWNRWFGEEPAATADVDSNAEEYTGDRGTYTGKKNTDTIDIPGFDVMNLKANTKEQSVNLYNPEQNSCYFKISLILADGTRLWQSGLVEPGKAIYNLTLEQALDAGEYADTTLKYE